MWSSLRNAWSKHEILEVAEGGTRVLNLSNDMEEIVNPENVWNGTPKLGKRPFEAIFQTGGNLYFMSSDDTTTEGKGSVGDSDLTRIHRDSPVRSGSPTSAISPRPTEHLSRSRACNPRSCRFRKL